MDDEGEETSDRHNRSPKKKKSSIVIEIPSYQEVLESSQSKSSAPPLFAPSQTFSQAFSHIKKSEFYTPPPSRPPPPPDPTLPLPYVSTPPAQSSNAAEASAASSRRIGEPEASLSTMAAPAASSSANFVQRNNAILVSHRQKGNPLLKYIRNVKWNFADVIPDYLLGQNSCALYLSLRYHLLHPDYLYYRIRELQKNFRLRVVLCHVDVEDVVKPLLEVTRTALLHDCTLLCGWSLEECGRYLETVKVYENKPADIIQGHMDTDYLSRLNHALTAVRHVNKTDVVTLGSTFGSLSNIMDASMEDLARCPGIGERKVKRLYDTFHEPFKHATLSRPAVAEASPQNNIKLSPSRGELLVSGRETDNVSNHKKKEPEVTVKSALSTAFKKYEEIKKSNTSLKTEVKEASARTDSNADTRDQ
ncbi:Excision repair cross-complementation group 1 [Dionaea muscipula]